MKNRAPVQVKVMYHRTGLYVYDHRRRPEM